MSDTVLPPPTGITRADNTLNELIEGFDTFRDMLISSPLVKELSLLNDNLKDNTEATEENTESNEDILMPEDRGIPKEGFFSNLFDKMGDKISMVTKNSNEELATLTKGALLGPLQLITNPLQELTGFSLGGAFSNVAEMLKPKPFKGTPNRQKVLPEDPGAVYVGDILKKIFGKDKEDDSGLTGKLGDSFLGKLPVGALLKGGAITALAGGLIWAGVDAIRGWMAAEKFGTSKIAGGIGGLLGGMDSGFKGAFKNMGKWALVGAGAGFLVGGPVGALAGGLIGAALGGVLGFIGGERIAKGVDKAIEVGKQLWEKVSSFIDFKELFTMMFSPFVEIFKGVKKRVMNIVKIFKAEDKNMFQKISGILKEFTLGILEVPFNYVKGVFLGYKKLFTLSFLKQKLPKPDIKGFLSSLGGFFKTVFQGLFNSIMETLDKMINFDAIKEGIMGAFDFSKEFIMDKVDFLSGIKYNILSVFNTDFVKSKFDFISGIVDNIKEGMQKAFGGLFDMFGFISKSIEEKGVIRGFGSALKDLTVGQGKQFEIFKESQKLESKQEIIKVAQQERFDDRNIKIMSSEKEAMMQENQMLKKQNNDLLKTNTQLQKDNLEVNKTIAQKQTNVNVNVPKTKEKKSFWSRIRGR